MTGAIRPAGWSRRQAELLAERTANDERLIEEYARRHGRRDIDKLRTWVRHVRGDIGAMGVITDVYVKPDGEIGVGFYIEEEPSGAPEPAGGSAPPPDLRQLGSASQMAAPEPMTGSRTFGPDVVHRHAGSHEQ